MSPWSVLAHFVNAREWSGDGPSVPVRNRCHSVLSFSSFCYTFDWCGFWRSSSGIWDQQYSPSSTLASSMVALLLMTYWVFRCLFFLRSALGTWQDVISGPLVAFPSGGWRKVWLIGCQDVRMFGLLLCFQLSTRSLSGFWCPLSPYRCYLQVIGVLPAKLTRKGLPLGIGALPDPHVPTA